MRLLLDFSQTDEAPAHQVRLPAAGHQGNSRPSRQPYAMCLGFRRPLRHVFVGPFTADEHQQVCPPLPCCSLLCEAEEPNPNLSLQSIHPYCQRIKREQTEELLFKRRHGRQGS